MSQITNTSQMNEKKTLNSGYLDFWKSAYPENFKKEKFQDRDKKSVLIHFCGVNHTGGSAYGFFFNLIYFKNYVNFFYEVLNKFGLMGIRISRNPRTHCIFVFKIITQKFIFYFLNNEIP